MLRLVVVLFVSLHHGINRLEALRTRPMVFQALERPNYIDGMQDARSSFRFAGQLDWVRPSPSDVHDLL